MKKTQKQLLDPKAEISDYRAQTLEKLLSQTKLLMNKALTDAQLTGYGFIVVKKGQSFNMDVRHYSWLEVEKALREIGCIGPIHK